MKKVLSFLLVAVLVLSAIALVACTSNDDEAATTVAEEATTATDAPAAEKLKLGLGVVTAQKGADATEEKNGSAQADVTMAAVLLDKDGKIVDVKIDVAQNKVAFTLDGKAVTAENGFKTKKELGTDYGMSKTGKVEWDVQTANLEKLLVGKTLAEATALVADGGKGVEAVQTAGCTITISDMIKAVEKAIKNAKECDATAADTLTLAAVTAQSTADAEAEKAGKNQVDTTIAAVVVNADKKVVAVVTDVQQVKFAFDVEGKFTTDTTAELKTKTELGNDYGMSKTGKVEWYLQNEALDTLCIGKTSAEITAFVAEGGKGVEAVQTAGCTVTVSDLVTAITNAIAK